MRISPAVGLTTPARILIRVDLPAPLSPIRPTTSPRSTCRSTPPRAKTRPYDLVTPFNSMSRSLMSILPGREAGARTPPLDLCSTGLAETLGGEVGDRLVIFRCHEAGAGVDVHRAEAIDDLLAERQDRHIALQEGLLVGGELDPAVLEGRDDLRAGVEADIDDLARLLAGRLHVGGGIAERLAAGIGDELDVGIRL